MSGEGIVSGIGALVRCSHDLARDDIYSERYKNPNNTNKKEPDQSVTGLTRPLLRVLERIVSPAGEV
ncbi:MAG: hypothetical protein CMP84_15165 [Gammaproteobacteria bacterium]|nr:hypothetical protein [Gammaproteobacteria bacterium]